MASTAPATTPTATVTAPSEQPAASQTSKGRSYNENWLDFDQDTNDFFEQNFPTQGQCRRRAPFFIKASQKTSNGSIQFNQSIISYLSKHPKLSGYLPARALQQNINILFDLAKERTVWMKSDNGNFKVHYDNGDVKVGELGKWNIFGSLGGNWKLDRLAYKVGALKQIGNFDLDLRYRVNVMEKAITSFLYQKVMWSNDNFTVGFLGVYDFKREIVQKNDIFLSFKNTPNSQISLSCYADGFRSVPFGSLYSIRSYFDMIGLSYWHTFNQKHPTKIGFKSLFNVMTMKLQNVQVAAERRFGAWGSGKVKVNTMRELSGVYQYKLNDRFNILAGGRVAPKAWHLSFGLLVEL